MRPTTIHEVSSRIANDVTKGEDIWSSMPYHMSDFRHWLIPELAKQEAAVVIAMVVTEAPVKTGSQVADAYLAGLAEYLSQKNELVVPAWANDPRNFLKEPFYAGTKSIQDLLLATTPSAWRRRLIFCGESSF